jgi:hypothetical protein
MGPSFTEEVDTFVDEFDQIILEHLGKVCGSTGQTQEELLKELESLDIDDSESDEESDISDYQDNSDDSDLCDYTDETESQGGKIIVKFPPSPKDEEKRESVLRPLGVNSRPMYLLRRRVGACYNGKKENMYSSELNLPERETLRKLMKC